MTNKDELIYKIEELIEYLKNNNGYNYKLYNHLCPGYGEPDSNIVEYAKDILDAVSHTVVFSMQWTEKTKIKMLLFKNKSGNKVKEYIKRVVGK